MLRSTNGAMMSFDYGRFLGHGQRDKMGITLFANGKLWLADYGTPGYGAAILPWYQSTFAHNTVVVDGKSQSQTKENECKLWLGGTDLEAVRSETSEAYPGVAHTRTVVRMGDCFVVADQLSSEAEHTYDLYLHSEGKLSLDGRKRETESSRRAGSLDREPGRASAGDGGIRPLGRRQEWHRILDRRDHAADAHHRPMSGRERLAEGSVAGGRQQGRAAEFVTVLCPYQGQLGSGGGPRRAGNHHPPWRRVRRAHSAAGSAPALE